MTLHPGTIATHTPDKPAVIIGNKTLTYGALDRDSRAIAAMLSSHGVQPRDVVAMLVGTQCEFFTIAWAAQRSGLYYLPISTRLTASEIKYILVDSGAKALFVDPALADIAAQASAGLPLLVFDIAAPALGSAEPPAVEGGDMLYTSGTTGKPKGVRRTLSLEPLGTDTQRVARASALFGLGADSIFLSPAPFYHAAPLRFTMNLLRTGGTIIGMPKFDAAEALRLIARHQITHSQWVPTMFHRLLALPAESRAKQDLSSHAVVIHAGGPCARDIKHQMIEWWGPILHEYYSGTESIGLTHVNSEDWLARPGTVGKPYGCSVHILDDHGMPLAAVQTGTVYFEGKAKFAYHNDGAKTLAAHSARGWATMGDIGHLDADGFLSLTDRRAFTVISGGINIYPTEVEAAIVQHPKVLDVAVFGIPDPDLGEALFAVVELTGEVLDEHQFAIELVAHLQLSLASYKVPRRYAFGPVGRTETGKVHKANLRDFYSVGRPGTVLVEWTRIDTKSAKAAGNQTGEDTQRV